MRLMGSLKFSLHAPSVSAPAPRAGLRSLALNLLSRVLTTARGFSVNRQFKLGRLLPRAGWFAALAVGAPLLLAPPAYAGSVDVTMHHLDTMRTGWNQSETTLNWASVGSGNFGLLNTVALDEQVDAQPLIISSTTLRTLRSANPNDVAIVVTENNTVYAIDSVTGAILNHRNLGAPVPLSALPGLCSNNGAVIGIMSTPVIDLSHGKLYVLTDTWENNAPVYRVHTLNLFGLALNDLGSSVVVSAKQTLSDGTVTTFNPATQRQRSALLLANGNVYAGFASYCDFKANLSRGWLLGWQASNLSPLPNVALMNGQTLAETPPAPSAFNNFYLSSIWASGFGPATDSSGNIFVTTGNSNTYRPDNLQESVLKISPALDKLLDYFTPSNFVNLDQHDTDLGAGGVLVVPDQPGGLHFATAAGKDGRLFLLNRDNMGGLVSGGPDKPPSVNAYECWCGPSYFVGSDGKARIISSGGNRVVSWLLPTVATGTFTREVQTNVLPSGLQDPGFMTSISSNGQQAGTAIVWAVTRPFDSTNTLTLYAFKADGGLAQLYSSVAGSWVNLGGNANVVPVAAGGKVYVASYKALSIFGLAPAAPAVVAEAIPAAPLSAVETAAPASANVPPPVGGSRYFGRVVSVSPSGTQATLELRNAQNLTVDFAPAISAKLGNVIYDGIYLKVEGTMSPSGVFEAQTAVKVKAPGTWGSDVP